MSDFKLMDAKKIGDAVLMVEKDINDALMELRVLRVSAVKIFWPRS